MDSLEGRSKRDDIALGDHVVDHDFVCRESRLDLVDVLRERSIVDNPPNEFPRLLFPAQGFQVASD